MEGGGHRIAGDKHQPEALRSETQGNPQDLNVAIIVSGWKVKSQVSSDPVKTTQIARRSWTYSASSPDHLQAVRIEHTRQLPLRSPEETGNHD
jgi:hypothetical protein